MAGAGEIMWAISGMHSDEHSVDITRFKNRKVNIMHIERDRETDRKREEEEMR